MVARAPAERLAERTYEIGIGCLAHYAVVAKTGELPDVGGRFKTYRQTFIHADWRPLVAGEPTVLRVPPDAPYSYEGDVISFYWGVLVRSSYRQLAVDAYVPLAVAP